MNKIFKLNTPFLSGDGYAIAFDSGNRAFLLQVYISEEGEVFGVCPRAVEWRIEELDSDAKYLSVKAVDTLICDAVAAACKGLNIHKLHHGPRRFGRQLLINGVELVNCGAEDCPVWDWDAADEIMPIEVVRYPD